MKNFFEPQPKHRPAFYARDPNGNRTPGSRRRGAREKLATLREERCAVAYDGYCGYNALGKACGLALPDMMRKIVAQCDRPDSAVTKDDRIQARRSAAGALACLEAQSSAFLPSKFWASTSTLQVASEATGKKILVLDDVRSPFANVQLAYDALLTPDGKQQALDREALAGLSRPSGYDALLIHEEAHWVYAVPAVT